MYSLMLSILLTFVTHRIHRKRKTHCNSAVTPSIDYSPPPDKVEKMPIFGNYCIKSTIDFVDSKRAEDVYTITGYDDNLGIQKKVNSVCNSFICDNPSDFACENERLVFLGPMENCNGRIEVKDVINGKEFFF